MNKNNKDRFKWKRNTLMVSIILIGVLLIIIAPMLKNPPKQKQSQEEPIKVRTMLLSELDVIARATGFGKVSPRRTWESVAEVQGQVSWVSEELRDGKIVKAGSELLRIEDSNYRLVLAQSEALLLASDAKYKTSKDSLAIAEKSLKSLQLEYNRQKKLAAKGTISRTALDNSERQMLTGQTQLKNLQNSLILISAEHKALIAQRDVAMLDLSRTIKIAPFDARITQVNIGVAQYANKGQLMFTADGLDVAEIEARFSVGSLRPLMQAMNKKEQAVATGIVGLNARVYLRTASHTVEWPATIDRVSGNIDPLTQTIGVIVSVEKPFALSKPGERPPLLRDTFVEVELSSPPTRSKIVIPRSAINGESVYLVNESSRISKRNVELDFSQRGFTVIKSGLIAGESVIISDLIMASEGLLVTPEEDKEALKQLIFATTERETER